ERGVESPRAVGAPPRRLVAARAATPRRPLRDRHALRRCRAGPGCPVRGSSADRRADVDDAFVLDRHERIADLHDQLLSAAEDVVVAPAPRAIDLDLDLADRLCREAGGKQVAEEAIAVWDPSCADWNRASHTYSIPRIQD